jgi:hypothetical protein
MVVEGQPGARLPIAHSAPLRLAERLAMRSRIENRISRRHIQRRMADLMQLAR